jgi:hypothetical protein
MAGQLTIDTLKASSGVLATQNGMTGIAKAWVQFAGATGTIASAFNVSSITRNSTGDYSVNFTTAMPNANYAVNATTSNYGNGTTVGTIQIFQQTTTQTQVAPTTSNFRFVTYNYNYTTVVDPTYVCVSIQGS